MLAGQIGTEVPNIKPTWRPDPPPYPADSNERFFVNDREPPSPSADEQINLHAHLLRHTSLKETARKKGVEFAVKKAGHSDKSGARHIWRYLQPSEQEMEEAEEDLF